MLTWAKKNGAWAARGPISEFLCGRYVMVVSKDGRETLCRITGIVPAVIDINSPNPYREPTEVEWNRVVTVEVQRETRPMRELMDEVPRGF